MRRALILMAVALTTTAAEPLDVEVRNDRVWLESRAAPRAAALTALANAAEFELKMNAEFAEPITVRLQDVPMTVAIQRLTRPHSSVVLHENASDGTPRIARVSVYQRTQAAAAPRAQRRAASGNRRSGARGNGANRIEELAQVLRTSSDSRAQRRAITELRRLGGESAVVALSSALESPDKKIRSYTVAVLGQIGSPGAVSLLGQVATSDEDPDVRIRAVVALARQHGEQARQAVEVASGDPNQRVREAAQSRLDAW